MNLRVFPGLPRFGTALLLVVAAACGNGGTGDGHWSVSGGSSSLTHVDSTNPDSDNQVPQDHGVPTEVLATAREATFQVTGLGCTKAQFGTAFVVADQTLVTNAHVVAGIQAPRITIRGREVISRVVAFDPAADLAVLAVDEPLPERLPLGEATPGAVVALLGHDHDGSSIVRPARVNQAILATGKDIYGEQAEGRRALMVDAWVETGFSGGPIVDQSGTVVGVVFSRARGGSPVAYAIQIGEVVDLLDEARVGPEGSGPCR